MPDLGILYTLNHWAH